MGSCNRLVRLTLPLAVNIETTAEEVRLMMVDYRLWRHHKTITPVVSYLQETMSKAFRERNSNGPWWKSGQPKPVFDRDSEYTKLASCSYGYPHPEHYVFAQVNKRIGYHPRYFVVFAVGDKPDDSKTRFFVTHSGAKSYFEHLIGLGEPREKRNKNAPWGWKSLEALERFINQQIV